MGSTTVVLYPFPAIGHLVSMVELAKLIHARHPSISIGILLVPAPYETGSTENYINTVSTTTPSITFHHLPTIAFPPDFPSDFMDLGFAIPEIYNPIVHDTLVAISENSTIKAVVLDFFSDAAFPVSKALDLPTYYFYTSGASGLCEFLYLTTIHNTTSKNIKDLNIYFDVPGVPPIHSSDMPSVLFDRESKLYKNFVRTSGNMAKSCGIIANSFPGLEERAVEAIRAGKCVVDGPTPPVYLIGPLIAGSDQMDPKQLKEIAFGLEKSGQRFLWVVRNPPPDDENDSSSKELDLDACLPEGFLTRIGDKGLVVKNWALQPTILGHDSVGGFVSHCGWNSVLEAVVAGVPMVGWPLYAEQKMNRVFLVEEMKVALAVEMLPDGFVTAESVEEKVRELMEGKEGRMVKEMILEMSRRAKAAVEEGGSSKAEFFRFTQSWTELIYDLISFQLFKLIFLTHTHTHMVSTTVVLYPSLGIGHLVPMVELAKLIHTRHPTLSVVILITPVPSGTGSTDKYIKTISTSTPSITFHHLPTIALPPDFSSNFIALTFGVPDLYNPIVHDTLVTISEKSTIKAVILDFFMNAAFQVAKTLDLPTYYFYTGGASALCAFLYLPTIHDSTSGDMKDLDVYFDIPGIPPIHALDFPTVMFERESNSYKKFMNTAVNMAKSCGIIVNSFVGLEERAVQTVRDGKCIPDRPSPPVYLIGPLIADGDQVEPKENECLKWLNSQPSKSVVFLCFGSMGVFKREQLKEIAIGLEKSGQRFLWVVRDPPPGDETESTWSSSGGEGFDLEGFVARSFDKGMVVRNWAPQPAILGHDSVGGFVSHCGWNSTLEAVVAGVPMVAWPLYAEQKMNKVYLVQEIKVAMAVRMAADGFVTADAVEEAVRGLMEGDGGRTVRERVLEMSGRAKAVVEDGGSSRLELFKLTQPWIDPKI
ncbi:hypothetical protein OSB04_026131 [Centaurea solstitialis]|uniref:UDP-glycosyltransferases domain-containing protein n=1 Tax=Centaurea solstitialis TaxID=347529 RepID=A0AA38SBC5_9ASTR|nr:hypothetical protein OSB04_026131 [Centaurea solstitialis]